MEDHNKIRENNQQGEVLDMILCDNFSWVFPMHDHKDHVVDIVEKLKKPSDAMATEENKQLIEFFQTKFRRFSKWLLARPPDHDISLEMNFL